MGFKDEKNELVGFDIDLMKLVAEAGGFDVEFRNTAWDGIFAGLKNKQYDAVISSVDALVSSVADDVKDITAKIRKGEGSLGKLIYDDALYNDARDVVHDLKVSLRERNVLDNIESSMDNLSQISEKINSGQGTLGQLVNDDKLYVEAKKMIKDVRVAVDDVRETSPIVTFSSIYFGAF